MLREKFTLNHRFSCILIFLLIYVNESIMFRELYSATFRGIVTIVCFLVVCIVSMLFQSNRNILLNRRAVMCYILLMACIGISIAFNGINATFDIYGIFLMTVGLMAVCVMNRKIFYSAFVDVMTFLAAMSVIIFLGYHILPKMLFSFFPNYYWHSGILMKNCYLTVLQMSADNFRNFGIFFEPGYYSVFLVWALIIALFKQKINIRKTVILFIALLTTLSTNGYVCAVMLMAIFVFLKSGISIKQKKRMAFCILILLFAIVVFMINNPTKVEFLVGKFSEISGDTVIDSSSKGSGYERWRAVIYAIEAFLDNPIAGIGQTGWQIKFAAIIGTATPLNWFGLRGLIYGAVMNYYYLKNVDIKDEFGKTKWSLSLTLMVVLICNVLSQNMVNDIFVFIFVFFQAGRYERVLQYKHSVGIEAYTDSRPTK